MHKRMRKPVGPGAGMDDLPALAAWTAAQRSAVVAHSTTIDVPAGDVVASAWARIQPFVIVIAGMLAVERSGEPRRLLGPGQCWGSETLLGAAASDEVVSALVASRLAVVQPGEFHRLFATVPPFASMVARDLAKRVTTPA